MSVEKDNKVVDEVVEVEEAPKKSTPKKSTPKKTKMVEPNVDKDERAQTKVTTFAEDGEEPDPEPEPPVTDETIEGYPLTIQNGRVGDIPFHNFQFREEVLIQLNFNVLFEIDRVRKELGDDEWNKPKNYESSKYKKQVYALLTLLDTYENVKVQESRNGYILNREKIEAGNFYTKSINQR